MIMHSNNTNMSRGQLFYRISPFLPGCESRVVKSTVIFKILIIENSANRLSKNKTN